MTLGVISFGLSYVLFGIFMLLQVFDVWSTYRFRKLGTAHEGNAFMAWAANKIGFWPSMVVKLLLMGAAAAIVTFIYGFWMPLLISIMSYGVFVVPNILYIHKTK